MRKTLSLTAIAALIALPLLAGPTDASASCQGRKETGTVLGGIGGALLGNSVSRGGGGAVIGGLGGAVIGHEIAKSGCGSSRVAYRSSRTRYASQPGYQSSSSYQQQPARRVYYDQYGNPLVSPSPVYSR